jgi:hypothetical protein
MSLLAVVSLVAAGTTVPTCSWDHPGHNPFTGNRVEAVDRYTDIPADVRDRLKDRMRVYRFDEMAAIRRDSITSSRNRYSPEIRDMHFGAGTVCRTVSRESWSPSHVERGLVYCDSGHCLIVPTVCGNVSRVTQLETPQVAGVRSAKADSASRFDGAGGPPAIPGAEGDSGAWGDAATATPEPSFEEWVLAEDGSDAAVGSLAEAAPSGLIDNGSAPTSILGNDTPADGDSDGGSTPEIGDDDIVLSPDADLPADGGDFGDAVPWPLDPTAGAGIYFPVHAGTGPGAAPPLPVPEAPAWALWLGGLALLAHRRLRQRRRLQAER